MKRVLFIGQAPPQKVQMRPFARTRLYQWFEEAKIPEAAQKHFYFGALIDFFPGKHASGSGDRAPNPAEIQAGRAQLKKLIQKVKPDIIVPVGITSIRAALQNPAVTLQETIGQKFVAAPYGLTTKNIPIIPIPHPSGASRWVWQVGNGQLLKKALQCLYQQLFI